MWTVSFREGKLNWNWSVDAKCLAFTNPQSQSLSCYLSLKKQTAFEDQASQLELYWHASWPHGQFSVHWTRFYTFSYILIQVRAHHLHICKNHIDRNVMSSTSFFHTELPIIKFHHIPRISRYKLRISVLVGYAGHLHFSMITNDCQCKAHLSSNTRTSSTPPVIDFWTKKLLLASENLRPSFTQQSPWSFPSTMVDLRSRRRCCDVLAKGEMNGMCCLPLLHRRCYVCKKIAPLCILGAPQVLLASKGSISKVRSNNTCKRTECIFNRCCGSMCIFYECMKKTNS